MNVDMKQDWSKPIEVTDLDIAFGGKAMQLMPAYNEIPREFHCIVGLGATKWNKVAADWFYDGLKNVKWTPKPGIDALTAVRHIKAILSSFEPKHEHKLAGCAYLLSQFFDDITYDE